MQDPNLFKIFTTRLNKLEISYIVIGSFLGAPLRKNKLEMIKIISIAGKRRRRKNSAVNNAPAPSPMSAPVDFAQIIASKDNMAIIVIIIGW